ncbi:MAG: Fic family protein [Clostridiales Family XIII bacterium]|jgi:Fic family protein|nr:Fic family protein [Clostridiales Family XIII bacterium]
MNSREAQILTYIKEHGETKTVDIHAALDGVSLPTVKRDLAKLVQEGLIAPLGKGRGTRYALTDAYLLICPVDLDLYYQKEVDERSVNRNFNWDLIREVLPVTPLLSASEADHLNDLQNQFLQRSAELSPAAYRKEMERLAIDLSWKSSQIEGNTYSLLETERLLKEKLTAAGKTKEEAIMLLNHKDAIDFLIENEDFMKPVTVSAIEMIHSLLVKELDVDRNIRTRRVGISGTNYQPLDNEFQIKEALEAMCVLVSDREEVFEQALLGLLLISYIQPFMDGNKRTARIVSNAILMRGGRCPISFRTVDSIDYKKAMLLFYEQNNISRFKQIFIDQFEFAVNTYF